GEQEHAVLLSCCITLLLVLVPEALCGSLSCCVCAVVSDVVEHVGDVAVDVPAQLVFEFYDAWHKEVVCVVITGSVCVVVLRPVVDLVRLRITKRLTSNVVFGFDRFFCSHSWTGFFFAVNHGRSLCLVELVVDELI